MEICFSPILNMYFYVGEYMGRLCAIESEFRGIKISKSDAERLFNEYPISVIYMDSAKYRHKVTLDVDFANYEIPLFYNKKNVQIPKLRFVVLNKDIIRDMSIYDLSSDSTADVKLDFSLKGLDESIHNSILKDLHKDEVIIKKEIKDSVENDIKNVNDLDDLDFNSFIDEEEIEDDDAIYDDDFGYDEMVDVDNLELTDESDDSVVVGENDDDDVPFE